MGMKFVRRTLAALLAVMLLASAVPAVYAANNNVSASPADEEFAGIEWGKVDQNVYAVSGVNVRSGPGTEYQKLGFLNRGQSVRRTGIGDNGWSRVVYNGEVAYIHSSYLSTSKPDGSGAAVDYSNLSRQIAIATGLKEKDYTKESWSLVKQTLEQAEKALKSTKQADVDAAEQALKDAVAALVQMDYSALWAILMEVEALNESDKVYDLWADLVVAADNGKALLSSGDQAAVDQGTAEIYAALNAAKAYLAEAGKPQVVVKEVEVEVPPKDDFCNIPMHRIWPVLFVISAALNVGLVVLMVGILRKKQKQTDDTPLIDYDIDDDFEE